MTWGGDEEDGGVKKVISSSRSGRVLGSRGDAYTPGQQCDRQLCIEPIRRAAKRCR